MSQASYKLKHQLRKLYWFLLRPKTTGVKCIIKHQGRILMIKRTLPNSKWVFPGGAVMKGESFMDAAKREVKEDLGLTLNNVTELGNFTTKVHYRTETIYCFTGEVTDTNLSGDEVKLSEVKWFSPEELPHPLTPISQKVYDLYLAHGD
ncbi:MAG TPA: NUDIX hydrolase [Candidatus Paceibacterota bacterium]|nr:NUDIX hydrolase [Candidatus Paceibacterota bacterium]